MIALIRQVMGWIEFDFSEIESRKRAAQDMKRLHWRRYENRWVDGY